MSKIELLAPAGDLERLKYALHYGADAVYIGGPVLGLRANAINFSFEDIKEGVEYAHSLNKKVYITVNIVLHNKEVLEVLDYLKKLEECNVDAIIASDAYVIEMALNNTSLEVHLSTQASTLNKEACEFWKNLGVTRVVLAREATIEDIKDIKDNVDIEIECFIHGAMCASISGRCVMSNFLTNRDANRGGCSQICRWDFNLFNEEDKLIEGEKPFTFCAKDLSMLSYIDQMIDLGITSYKIEGRMRSIYYIATVVNIYRKVMDEYLENKNNYKYNEKYEKILRDCANRDSVPQFFNGIKDERASYYNGREETTNQDFIGVILDYTNGIATIEERNYFERGTKVEIFGPNHEIIDYTFDEIIDEDNNIIDIVRHPRQIVKIKTDLNIEKYDLIRLKKTL